MSADDLVGETRMSSIKAAKKALRRSIAQAIASVSPDDRAQASVAMVARVRAHPAYAHTRAVGMFLSMADREIDTMPLVQAALADGKRVYVPKCMSRTAMTLLRVDAIEEIDEYQKTEWGIPEPGNLTSDGSKRDAFETAEFGEATGDKDTPLLVCPGVAFSEGGRRLGHGAGYYDRYLNNIRRSHGNKSVATLGIGLACQLVACDEDIPWEEATDVLMDDVITL
ncbi:hypothetical protein PYCC9005_003834 [Savitreella phatthalungensis]